MCVSVGPQLMRCRYLFGKRICCWHHNSLEVNYIHFNTLFITAFWFYQSAQSFQFDLNTFSVLIALNGTNGKSLENSTAERAPRIHVHHAHTHRQWVNGWCLYEPALNQDRKGVTLSLDSYISSADGRYNEIKKANPIIFHRRHRYVKMDSRQIGSFSMEF